MNEVLVADQQEDHALDLEEWTGLAGRVLEAEGIHGELSLAFVSEAVMADLNQRFRGRSGPTDVLSFPIDDQVGGSDPFGEQPVMLGDVVVCPAVAARNAANGAANNAAHNVAHDAGLHGHLLQDEMALLVVHGILHLGGMDHEDETEALAMEERERQLLAQCRSDHRIERLTSCRTP